MNKINSLTNYNIEKNTNKDIDAYNDFKSTYQELVKKLNAGDFKNSQTRYITELEFVIDLKEMAKERNIESEYKQWDEKEKQIREVLLKNFGVEFDE